jgi:hypothetical protein
MMINAKIMRVLLSGSGGTSFVLNLICWMADVFRDVSKGSSVLLISDRVYCVSGKSSINVKLKSLTYNCEE